MSKDYTDTKTFSLRSGVVTRTIVIREFHGKEKGLIQALTATDGFVLAHAKLFSMKKDGIAGWVVFNEHDRRKFTGPFSTKAKAIKELRNVTGAM